MVTNNLFQVSQATLLLQQDPVLERLGAGLRYDNLARGNKTSSCRELCVTLLYQGLNFEIFRELYKKKSKKWHAERIYELLCKNIYSPISNTPEIHPVIQIIATFFQVARSPATVVQLPSISIRNSPLEATKETALINMKRALGNIEESYHGDFEEPLSIACREFENSNRLPVATLIRKMASMQMSHIPHVVNTKIPGLKISLRNEKMGEVKSIAGCPSGWNFFVKFGFMEWLLPIVNADGSCRSEDEFQYQLKQVCYYGPYLNAIGHGWAKQGFFISSFFGSQKDNAIYLLVYKIGSEGTSGGREIVRLSEVDPMNPKKIDSKYFERVELPGENDKVDLQEVLGKIASSLVRVTDRNISNDLQKMICTIENYLSQQDKEWRVLADNKIHLSILNHSDKEREYIEGLISQMIAENPTFNIGSGFWMYEPSQAVRPIFEVEAQGTDPSARLNFTLTFERFQN